jgi:transposase-like protein
MNPMTTRTRRRYTDEQRAEAVELCIKDNLTLQPSSQTA